MTESESTARQWQRIRALFIEGLEKEKTDKGKRVSMDDFGLKLHFDLTDPLHMSQFERLGNLIAERKKGENSYRTRRTRKHMLMHNTSVRKDLIASMTLPFENDVEGIDQVAHLLRIREDRRTDVVRRPVMPGEPSHVLEQLTDIPWQHVEHTPYYSHVVAAAYPPPDAQTRDRQEEAIARLVLKPAFASVEYRDWKEHRTKVAQENGLPLSSLVPKDWVESGAQRADSHVNGERKRELSKLFQPNDARRK